MNEGRPPSDPNPTSDAALLARYTPYLKYDSLESFRADSAATLPEMFFDDGSKWSYANTLHAGGKVVAAARPQDDQQLLDLDFLGRKYKNGKTAKGGDYLDEVGRRYVEDARRMHAKAQYADRIYGHAVRDATGHTWLQYWFFYYYNNKSFVGFGLHEGDWEMIQLRLGDDRTPDSATYAQHDAGQALEWSDLELHDSADGKVPVVYVGRGSHASFHRPGEHFAVLPLPQPDYADGKGAAVRPAVDVISDSGPRWALWPGKWGSSDSSPRGPSAHKQWHEPAGFHADVREHITLERAAPPPRPPTPAVEVHRVGDHVVLAYTFPPLGERQVRPAQIVVSVDTVGDDLPPSTHAFPVREPKGVVAHPTDVGDARIVVRVVAYSEDGVARDEVTVEPQ